MTTWIVSASSTKVATIVQHAGTEANLLLLGTAKFAHDFTEQLKHSAEFTDTNLALQRIVHLETTELAENFAQEVAAWLAAEGATTVLATDESAERALLGAVAAKLGAAWISSAFAWDAQSRTATTSVAGLSHHSVAAHGPVVLTLPAAALTEIEEVSEASNGAASLPELEHLHVNAVPVLEVLATTTTDHTDVDLSKAKRVIGVGRGIAKREDLAIVESLAEKIGAQIGATRPLAEGYGWFDSYIGLTGQPIAAELYIAVGLSGQIHHSGGVRESQVIVAINDDPQAPIFAEADYAIVGDLYEVLPQIESQL